MKAIPWPNGLGWDIGTAEVWLHNDCFRVFTAHKVLGVPFTVTTDPFSALGLCHKFGLSRKALDEMLPDEARAAYLQAKDSLRSHTQEYFYAQSSR